MRNFSNAGENLSISLFPFGKSVDRDPIILNGSFNVEDIVRQIQERSINRGDTDIGAAIQFATSQAPGSAALLMSDGFETLGNAKESARTFAASGGTIYPLLPGDEAFQSQALELSMLQLPLTSKAKDLVEARVTTRNNTGKIVSGKLEVLLDDSRS